jgi:hypothetical protein
VITPSGATVFTAGSPKASPIAIVGRERISPEINQKLSFVFLRSCVKFFIMDKIGLYKSFKIHDLKTTKSNQKIKFLLPN